MTGGRLPGYGPQLPSQADLWSAQNAPRIANAAGCTDAEYERLLSDRQQTEAAYLARWGSLAPEPRTEAELAAAARAEAWGPQSPVPYLLTPAAEAALAKPEAELEAAYPSFDDDPATWGLLPPEPMAEAELAAAAQAGAWGPRGPAASYAEWLAEGEPEAEP